MTQPTPNPRTPALVTATIDVTVQVYRIDDPQAPHTLGNTASGQYIVLFDPEVVHVHEPGISTRVRYLLSADSVQRGFAFSGAFSSDPCFQLNGPFLDASAAAADPAAPPVHDRLWYLHSNTHASLISLSLQFKDLHREGRRIAYDPQVTNTPGDD